jgi:hypothetical protein
MAGWKGRKAVCEGGTPQIEIFVAELCLGDSKRWASRKVAGVD